MLRMNLSLAQTLEQECEICGRYFSKGHTDSCPIGKIEYLVSLRVYIICPKCKDGRISINNQDLYECRACHRQFTCGMWADTENPEEVYLDDPSKDLVICHVLTSLGRGEFKYDKAIEDLRNEIEKFRKK